VTSEPETHVVRAQVDPIFMSSPHNLKLINTQKIRHFQIYSQTLQQTTYLCVYLFLVSFISNKYKCTVHIFFTHCYINTRGWGGGGLRTHATVYCIRMQHNGINRKITMHSYCRLISNYTHNTWPPL
jgi:hypothetical protein